MECLINGLKINYQVMGEGRPFLILHGWGSSSDKWQKVGEGLAERGLKIIIPDLPGFGKSQEPKEAWNLDDYCDFVKEFVKFLGLDKFYLLGHSFGGNIAIKSSLKYTQKIKKLFLLASAYSRKKTLKKRILTKISTFLKMFTFGSSSSFYVLFRKLFYKLFVQKSDYLFVQGIMRETFLKVLYEDLSGSVSYIQIPTVIIWGEKDKTTPIKDAYFLKEKIKNSKLEIISGAGHNLHLEAPKELGDRVSQWLL